MDAKGGRPPLVKEEDEFDPNNPMLNNIIEENSSNTNRAGISNDEFGFNSSSINEDCTGLSSPPLYTMPPGINPSEFLDSLVMLPNAQDQLSPTTGTFRFPSPDCDSFNLASNGDGHFRSENKPFEEFEYPRDLQEMRNTEMFQGTLEGSSKSREEESLSRNQNAAGKERSGNRNQKGGCVYWESDGFCWKKYGQKQVKGSECPRSYYKCSNRDCRCTKKVERSHDGHISAIMYSGLHNHPVPQPSFKRFNEAPSEDVSGFKRNDASSSSDWRPDNSLTNAASSSSYQGEFADPMATFQSQQFPPAFGSQEVDRDEASPESISNEEDDEASDCWPRKRRKESFPSETATGPRSTRESKVVVQVLVESEVDILEDGYRWRKYGQKVVKGNPNPRSYYKCTTTNCPVRKHVERAADNKKSVLTTYEGKHTHQVPANCSKSSSTVANLPPSVANAATTSSAMMAHKSGKQHLPSVLNYNLPGHLNLQGSSSLYNPLFPPFRSLPCGPLLMNSTNQMNTPSSSNLYPMIPDHMMMPLHPSQINTTAPALPGSTSSVPPQLGANFNYNSYYGAAVRPLSMGQQAPVEPREEQREDDDLFDTCLSIFNHDGGNGTM